MRNSFIISLVMHIIFAALIINGYGTKNRQTENIYVVDLMSLPPDLEITKNIVSFKTEHAEASIKEDGKTISDIKASHPETGKKVIPNAGKNISPSENFSPEQYISEIKKKLNAAGETYSVRNTSDSEPQPSHSVQTGRKTSLASKIFPLSNDEHSTGLSVGFQENKLPAGNIIPLDYLENIRRILQKKWKLPEERNYSLTAYVSFTLKRDGTITDVFIEKSSGVKSFDESALKAIQDTQRLQPLPSTYQSDYLIVTVKFNMRGLE